MTRPWWQHAISQALANAGRTGHPILHPWPQAKQQALTLAKAERFCEGAQVATALEVACCRAATVSFQVGLEGQSHSFLCKAQGQAKALLKKTWARSAGPRAVAVFKWPACFEGHGLSRQLQWGCRRPTLPGRPTSRGFLQGMRLPNSRRRRADTSEGQFGELEGLLGGVGEALLVRFFFAKDF